MSLIFPELQTADPKVHTRLDDVYEKACDQLVGNHRISPARLGRMIEPMTAAITDLYNAGERDEARLVKYAVSRALETARASGQWLSNE